MTWNDIPKGVKIEWAAADTEAYTLVDGRRLSSADIYSLGLEKSAAWWREHVTVDVYAWLITDGRNTACFGSWEEFADFCASHRISTVWWYNAKYDFSHIDYAMLTNGWTLNNGGKIQDREYRSLHGRQGQRYSLSVGREYRNPNRHRYTHVTRHYDLCNIFGGGLAKNLKAFNVVDFNGTPIRKLDMDYQGDDPATMRAYMDNDVIGLYHLVRTADEFLREKWGYTLTGIKPDVMTAGGLAKRVLLSYYNGGCRNHLENVKTFQKWHKVDLPSDHFYRGHGLYRGGITMINQRYQNLPITAPVYKYDINSMYPYQMANMPDLVDRPLKMDLLTWNTWCRRDQYKAVYMITEAHGRMRAGMLPMWYDRKNKTYTDRVDIIPTDTPVLMFDDELHELLNWYDLDLTIGSVYAFLKAPAHQYRAFILDNYKLKEEGKKTGNAVMTAFAKLLLNSSYGKLAENPYKDQSHRELNPDTGAVMLIEDGETEDEKCLLSVVMGALVTSMARVHLMELIRDVCPIPARDFIYCDTDSVASLTQYDKCDPYTLGALKDETEINGVSVPYTWCKYIAPKTYILTREINGKLDVEAHTKGIPARAVLEQPDDSPAERAAKINSESTLADIDRIFANGVMFVTLSAMNVRGGKALVPVRKYLCRDENTIIHGATDPATITVMEEA